MPIETYVTDLIEGRRKSSLMNGMLYAMSGVFETGVKLRNFAFDRHLLKATKVDVPVVSIGNIIAGGTGKTALIQKLARDLASHGKVSILIRGYRSKVEKVGGSLHLMENVRITPKECGDEAYLLSKTLPELSLFVGKNRVLSAQRAAYHEAKVILLDDGMQYRQLVRDLELVMLHADDLYGKGFYLPRGFLRDSPKRLQEADMILINHIRDEEHLEQIKRDVEKRTDAPIIGVHMVPKAVKGRRDESWDSIAGKRVAAFCGLGKPDSFMKTIVQMGGDLAQAKVFPDHIAPTEKQLKDFAFFAEAKGCELILCSEKDWVKLPEEWDIPLPVAFVEASLEVSAGHEVYEDLIQTIASKMKGAYETVD